MPSLIKVGNSYNTPVQEYICDTYQEFENNFYNVATPAIPIGSLVFIAETGQTFIKSLYNSIPEWKEIKSGSGGGGTKIVKITEALPLASQQEGF